jgi:hypothetical protein
VTRNHPHLCDHNPTVAQGTVEYSAAKSTTLAGQTTPTGQTVLDDTSVALDVFAVFATNHQPSMSRFSQKSWVTGDLAN